mgnify:CR=1 FL=1
MIPATDRPSFRRLWRQWKGLFNIYIQDGLAYRAQGFIWVLVDAATAITMPAVWIAASKGGLIQGYSPNDFILYYLSILLIGSFVTCHFMWDIGNEIREGIFSAQIIRPVSWFQYIIVRNFAWRLIRSTIFLPLFILFMVIYSPDMSGWSLNLGWEFWVAVVLGHLVSVCFVAAMSMIALFTQEAHAIFELYYFPMLFLSGQMFPVALLPDWAQSLAVIFPFYYTTGAPTEILIGRMTGPGIYAIFAIQIGWILGSYVLYRILSHYGLRYYTGVGM